MTIEIIGAESLGVRGLCCVVETKRQRIVIDPGIALGYYRHGLLPHPCQILVGDWVRQSIVAALQKATDVIFSHMHGDHVPLLHANPYQLAIGQLPAEFSKLSGWTLSPGSLPATMRQRFHDLQALLGDKLQIVADTCRRGMCFSPPVPHGMANSRFGSVMMSRIETEGKVFVHASDIQLLDEQTIHFIIDWRPDIVVAAGPPLYLPVLTMQQRELAWRNALQLGENVDVVILDHHLMRSEKGSRWLDALSQRLGKRIYCAADFMRKPRRLLEAQRPELYRQIPVPEGWHDQYAAHQVNPKQYCDVELITEIGHGNFLA